MDGVGAGVTLGVMTITPDYKTMSDICVLSSCVLDEAHMFMI